MKNEYFPIELVLCQNTLRTVRHFCFKSEFLLRNNVPLMISIIKLIKKPKRKTEKNCYY